MKMFYVNPTDQQVALRDQCKSTLQNLLGYADISTIMVYLHIAQCKTILKRTVHWIPCIMSSARRPNKPELATIVHRFGRQLIDGHKLLPTQVKALNNIARCRNIALGGVLLQESVFCQLGAIKGCAINSLSRLCLSGS
jgi:hypothetical protein